MQQTENTTQENITNWLKKQHFWSIEYLVENLEKILLFFLLDYLTSPFLFHDTLETFRF